MAGYLRSPHTQHIHILILNMAFNKNDIDHLKRLLFLKTRLVKGCRGLPYEERLEELSSFFFARRRLICEFILAYELSKGFFDISLEVFFTRPPCSSPRGQHLNYTIDVAG